jgi:hypothetical protein
MTRSIDSFPWSTQTAKVIGAVNFLFSAFLQSNTSATCRTCLNRYHLLLLFLGFFLFLLGFMGAIADPSFNGPIQMGTNVIRHVLFDGS